MRDNKLQFDALTNHSPQSAEIAKQALVVSNTLLCLGNSDSLELCTPFAAELSRSYLEIDADISGRTTVFDSELGEANYRSCLMQLSAMTGEDAGDSLRPCGYFAPLAVASSPSRGGGVKDEGV